MKYVLSSGPHLVEECQRKIDFFNDIFDGYFHVAVNSCHYK